MKTGIMIGLIVAMLVMFTGTLTFAGFEGYNDTFYGTGAGATLGSSDTEGDTFIGLESGYYATGYYNTFVGYWAGYYNEEGDQNTFLGVAAGLASTGSNNVFLGFCAGYNEIGSNKLYIGVDNGCVGLPGPLPLIYGEFDNQKLTINGNLEVIGPDNGLVRLSDNTTDNTMKASRMVLNHYANIEEPVYLFGAASTDTNNFVAFGGGSDIGNAATQIDLYTAPDTTTQVGYPRVTVTGNGNVGIGTQSPSHPLQMAGGAYSTGSSWVNASSREYKENIEVLSVTEAVAALRELNPVKFNYKAEPKQKQVGFIAEDVPELVAMNDRKGLDTMDIVAVLTRVVQEQEKAIKEQHRIIDQLTEKITDLEKEVRWNRSLADLNILK
jgi:hypothetical protein